MKILTILIISIIFKKTTPECLEGCLTCNTRDECLFCDSTNFFVLESKTCKKVVIENCKIIDIGGKCLECSENFYRDQQTFKCTKVLDTGIVENCFLYKSQSSCLLCKTDFYPVDGKCTAVTKKITNCEILDPANPSLCHTCKIDSLLSLDKIQCTDVKKIENCSSYSSLFCKDCKTNYIIERNKYIEDVYVYENVDTKFIVLQKIINDSKNKNSQGEYKQCKKIQIENCVKYKNYYQCQDCKENYFLTIFKTCEAYPLQQIDGCKVYQDGETCLDCIEGKFLQNSLTCVDLEPKTECVKHSTSAAIPFCLECSLNYFLDKINNVCKSRTENSLFSDCVKKDLYSDSCSSCGQNLQLTGDKLKCLPSVSNCENYEESNQNSTQLICKKCISGWYYSKVKGSCIQGSVINCEIYQQNSNDCESCKVGYYLNISVCEKQPELTGCLDYSKTIAKSCNQCDEKSVLFKQVNGCKLATPIERCEFYQSDTFCKSCVLDYYLVNNKCELIITPSNCRKLNELQPERCAICKSQYIINSQGLCVLPEDYFSLNCQQNNIDGYKELTMITCSHCIENAIPLNYQFKYICTKNSSLESSKLILDCLKYKISNGTYECLLCSGNKILGFDQNNLQTCTDQCNADEMVLYLDIQRDVQTSLFNLSIQKYSKCVKKNLATKFKECFYVYPTFINPGVGTQILDSYFCAKCSTITEKVVIWNSFLLTDDPVNFPLGTSILSAHPGTKCLSVTSDIGSTQLTKIQNCKYYYENYTKVNTIPFGCLRCETGYQGVVNSQGFIESCQIFTGCDLTTQIKDGELITSAKYRELKTTWSSYFSCYKCNDPSKIPFVVIQNSTLPAHSEYGPVLQLATVNTVNAKSVDCYKTIATDFGILTENFAFPTNCALGVINPQSTLNSLDSIKLSPTTSKIYVYCIACKAGFKPIYANVNNQYKTLVYDCAPLDATCESSTWFNACTKCRAGNTYVYDNLTKTIDFTNCASFSDENCFAFYESNSQKICKICKTGYTKNMDGICEQINAPKCSTTFMNFDISFEHKMDSTISTFYYRLTPQGTGCNKCLSGYVAIFLEQKQFFCTFSDYIQKQIYPNLSLLIPNCKNYSLDSNQIIVCIICQTNFVPSTDGKCYLQSNSPNCLLYQGAVLCIKCQSNYAALQGTCVKKSKENCLIYAEGVNLENLTCLTCAPDYYWNGSDCVKGIIQNCQELENEKQCRFCKTGYVKIVILNTTHYCYPISASLNCQQLNESKFANLMASCENCKSGFALTEFAADFNSTICMNFLLTQNCVQYHLLSNIEESTLKCIKCIDTYYLNEQNECKLRTLKVENCLKNKIEDDSCEKCVDGYYPIDQGKFCRIYPQGIKGCIKYSSSSVCVSCNKNLYIFDNKCEKIETKFKIENCEYYNNDQSCKICLKGFAVENGLCAVAQAKNCIEYKSKIACSKCETNYGFQEINSIIHCVQKNIAFCDNSEDFYPFNCLICSNNFYPENGKCKEVTESIKNCIQYSANNVCSQCITGTTLSLDKKTCNDFNYILTVMDQQCSNSLITESFCITCAPGFVMSNEGICSKCSDRTFDTGCQICHPINTSQCIMCTPGYYQKKDTSCSKIGTTTTTTTKEETKVVTTSLEKILSSLMKISFWILLII